MRLSGRLDQKRSPYDVHTGGLVKKVSEACSLLSRKDGERLGSDSVWLGVFSEY